MPFISIHALRVEGDHPARDDRRSKQTISIHALRVEGDFSASVAHCASCVISIHALRVEGDVTTVMDFAADTAFLSTPSGWRATVRFYFFFGIR